MESILPAIAFAVLITAQLAAVIAVQIQGHAEFFSRTSRPPLPGPPG